MAAVVFDQADAHRAIGRSLQPAVDRGVDPVALVHGIVAVAAHDLGARHLGDVRRFDVVLDAVIACFDRLLSRTLRGGGVDVVELLHLCQHVVTPCLRRLGIGDRVEARRRLRNAGKGGRLGHRELIERFAEIGFRGRGHAIGALAEKDHVQIGDQYLFLAELMLHAIGEKYFLQLAADGLVEAQEHVARRLHGDGAGALREIAGSQIHHGRAQHAAVIEAVVAEETLVFGGDERFPHQYRHVVVRHGDAALLRSGQSVRRCG